MTILILEHASLSALGNMQSHNEALNTAYSLLLASRTYNAITEQFPTDQRYSISEFIDFILNHRL